MCSTFKFRNIVGRNFDYEVSYDEKIVRIDGKDFNNKYKVMGVCSDLIKDYPLMYDGMNEHGLCVTALAFEGNAKYNKSNDEFGIYNIPAYDIVFWILSNFKDIDSFIFNLQWLNINNKQYSDDFPNSDLHWFIADKKKSIILESTEDGLNWYNGEVMTNNPLYSIQSHEYETFKDTIGNTEYHTNTYNTRGKETEGLDGSYTSDGRFERLSWLKDKCNNHVHFSDIITGFHLLASVEQIYGITAVEEKYEYTIYSIIYDMHNLNMYVKFYDDAGFLCVNCSFLKNGGKR